ncbi:hypothetical protein PINS_up024441 [Pythium insidiosum]|nr:hypothetical protein PINS_up024441 [Pythium insidiosum]
MMEKLQGKNVFSVTGGDLFSALEKASKGDDEISAYEEFDAGIRPAELVDIVLRPPRKFRNSLRCHPGERRCQDRPGDEARTLQQSAALAKRGKSGVRCANANKAIDWSKVEHRRLQETVANPSEPF